LTAKIANLNGYLLPVRVGRQVWISGRNCLWAARKLLSMVFLPLPVGLLISHFVPPTFISGVSFLSGRKNTTSALSDLPKLRARRQLILSRRIHQVGLYNNVVSRHNLAHTIARLTRQIMLYYGYNLLCCGEPNPFGRSFFLQRQTQHQTTNLRLKNHAKQPPPLSPILYGLWVIAKNLGNLKSVRPQVVCRGLGREECVVQSDYCFKRNAL